MEDSGFGGGYTPSINEIKSYFYGWKTVTMIPVSPYYKSEVPYTPSTWAEWKRAGVVGDATGIELIQDRFITSITAFKKSTKLWILI